MRRLFWYLDIALLLITSGVQAVEIITPNEWSNTLQDGNDVIIARQARLAVSQGRVIDYSWSPSGEWLLVNCRETKLPTDKEFVENLSEPFLREIGKESLVLYNLASGRSKPAFSWDNQQCGLTNEGEWISNHTVIVSLAPTMEATEPTAPCVILLNANTRKMTTIKDGSDFVVCPATQTAVLLGPFPEDQTIGQPISLLDQSGKIDHQSALPIGESCLQIFYPGTGNSVAIQTRSFNKAGERIGKWYLLDTISGKLAEEKGPFERPKSTGHLRAKCSYASVGGKAVLLGWLSIDPLPEAHGTICLGSARNVQPSPVDNAVAYVSNDALFVRQLVKMSLIDYQTATEKRQLLEKAASVFNEFSGRGFDAMNPPDLETVNSWLTDNPECAGFVYSFVKSGDPLGTLQGKFGKVPVYPDRAPEYITK